MNVRIWTSVSILALAAAPAIASAATADPTPEPAAAAAPGGQSGLEEIVVTAQRIRESAQRAPVAISVVKPDEVIREDIVRSEDLSRVVPALVAFGSGGPNTSFFLRGVGNTTVNSYSDPAISFNFDEVYIGRPNSTQGFFYDLDRVEVLKGPQGTIYGRNATGGAINVLPHRPEIGVTSLDLTASYGNYNAVEAQGALNLPIGHSVALRIAGNYDKHDGYYSDGTGDQDQTGARGQLLIDLAPNLTNRITADYEHQGGAGAGSFIYGGYVYNGTSYVFTPTPQLGSHVGTSDPRTEAYVQTRFISQVGRLSEAEGTRPSQDDTVWGVSDETNWDAGPGTLTVKAAYRESVLHALSTTNNFRGFRQDEHTNQITLESRFGGKIGTAVDYLLGGFYFNEHINNQSEIDQLTLLPIQHYKTGTNSKAGFARLQLHATNTLTLTAAGRYTDDVKFMDGSSSVYSLFCGSPAPPQDFCPTVPLMPLVYSDADVVAFYTKAGVAFGPPGSRGANTPTVFHTLISELAKLETKKFTYRLAADWQVTPRNLLYVSYETGFHGGGFNFGKGLETYAPETIGAVTVGSKNRFLDNRLQFNVEGYYWKYKNQQISQFGTDFSTPPISVFYTSNIGKSTIKGVDADFAFLLTPSTRINGSVQYLDTSYDSYLVYSGLNGPPPNFACPYSVVTHNGGPAYAVNCSGKPALFAPKWSFNVGLSQTVDLHGYSVLGTIGTRYRGDYFSATSYQASVVSPAGFQTDASLSLAPDNNAWSLTAFVNNIENTRRITQSNVNSSLGVESALATAPRTFGLRASVYFK